MEYQFNDKSNWSFVSIIQFMDSFNFQVIEIIVIFLVKLSKIEI